MSELKVASSPTITRLRSDSEIYQSLVDENSSRKALEIISEYLAQNPQPTKILSDEIRGKLNTILEKKKRIGLCPFASG